MDAVVDNNGREIFIPNYSSVSNSVDELDWTGEYNVKDRHEEFKRQQAISRKIRDAEYERVNLNRNSRSCSDGDVVIDIKHIFYGLHILFAMILLASILLWNPMTPLLIGIGIALLLNWIMIHRVRIV
jgi:hypothetical protein